MVIKLWDENEILVMGSNNGMVPVEGTLLIQ
jgi:hypothetical protein